MGLGIFSLTSCSVDGFCWPEKEVVVGDFGAPKADMKDKTMQGTLVPQGPRTRHPLDRVIVSPLERPIVLLSQSCRAPKQYLSNVKNLDVKEGAPRESLGPD